MQRRLKGIISKSPWLLWVAVTTILFLAANHLLVRGRAVGVWDVDTFYSPYQSLVADHARAGRLMTWNLWSNGGLPAFGEPQVGAFSPVSVGVGFIVGGSSTGFNIYWLLMWWLGGLGIMMLARHLHAPPWAACIVALGFLFSSAYTGHAEHTSFIIGFSFLPLIIWRLDAALCSRRIQPAVEAGALWGLSALSAYPALVIITGCFCALWAAGRWLFAESCAATSAPNSSAAQAAVIQPSLGFVFSTLALMLVVGFVILAPTYLTFFYEGAGTHGRMGGLSRERALEGSLDPGALTTFASPYLPILKLYNPGLWVPTDISSCSIYVGACITVLALLALFSHPRDGWQWWLVGLAILSIGCALGQTLPLRGWLYDWFYPMRFFRHPAIFRLYFLFCVTVLALLATRDLVIAVRRANSGIWTRFLTASCCMACTAWLAFIIISNRTYNGEEKVLHYVHVALVWAAICAIPFIGLKLSARRRQRVVPALLLALAICDAVLTVKLSKPVMFDTSAQTTEHWNSLDEKHSASLDLTAHGLRREESAHYREAPWLLNNDQMILKVPVFNSYASQQNDFHLKMTRHPILNKMATGAERIWFASEATQVAPTESNFVAFVNRTEALGASPLIIHSQDELLSQVNSKQSDDINMQQAGQIGRLPATEKVNISLIRYVPDELVFDVQCPADGWLLVTDRWARSWRAEVNGKQVPVYGGNFIFRAIQVSAGQNRVSFSYHPFGFPWLIWVSWGSLAVVAVGSVYAWLASPKTTGVKVNKLRVNSGHKQHL